MKKIAINRKRLLREILYAKTDKEKVAVLKRECKGMRLFRYRPYLGSEKMKLGGDEHYEVEATRTYCIWASRPDLFDDDYEGTIVNSKKSDVESILKCMSRINKEDAEKERAEGFIDELLIKMQGLKKMEKLLLFFKNSNRESRRKAPKLVDCRCLDELLREYRKNYAFTCFSENSPTNDNNLWKQYCVNKDGTIAGFCLEYDVDDLLDNGYVTCPIYYKDEVTISDLCREFDDHIESIYIHKNTRGYDKNLDPEKKRIISWENQNEWRIVRENRDQLPGQYLEKPVIPKKMYYLKDSPHIEDILNVFPGEKQCVEIEIN